MKKSLYIIVLLIVLAGLGAIALLQRNNADQITNPPQNEEIEATPDTSIPFEETETDDERFIKAALVEKNNWNEEEVQVWISDNDGVYASGLVGTNPPGPGGGRWFAKNVNGSWEIVWDGNGIVPCENLENYSDFSTVLIPNCYDSSTGEMIER